MTLPESIEATDGIHSDCKELLEKNGVSVSGEENVRILDKEAIPIIQSMITCKEKGIISKTEARTLTKFLKDKMTNSVTYLDLSQFKNMKYIQCRAFNNMTNLKTLILPEAFVGFSDHGGGSNGQTFVNCGVTSIDLQSCTGWGNFVLSSWPALKEITIRKAVSVTNTWTDAISSNIERINITSIEQWLNCYWCQAEVPSQGGEASLFLIGEERPITHIIIPISITKINAYALYNLKTITALSYEGTIEQWLAMSKGASWHTNVPATYIQCSDGRCGLDDTIETGNTYA